MKSFFTISLVVLLTACAHHNDVRPGTDGDHRVKIFSESKGQGTREALRQANHFCKAQNKNSYAAILKEEAKYTGSLDERTYKKLKIGSKVAQTVGGAAAILGGGEKDKKLGGIAMVGGAAVDIAAGDAYTVDVVFKCR